MFVSIITFIIFFIKYIIARRNNNVAKQAKTKKLTIASVIICLICFIGGIATVPSHEERALAKRQNEEAKQEQQLAEQKKEKEVAAQKAQLLAEEKAKEEQRLAEQKAEDDQLAYEKWVPEEIVRQAKNGLMNYYQDKVIENNQENGNKFIVNDAKLPEAFSNDGRIEQANYIMTNTLKNLYSANLPIEDVTFNINTTLVDIYGNKKEERVILCTVSKYVAKKVKWENFDSDNLPKIADDYWVHPALQ